MHLREMFVSKCSHDSHADSVCDVQIIKDTTRSYQIITPPHIKTTVGLHDGLEYITTSATEHNKVNQTLHFSR